MSVARRVAWNTFAQAAARVITLGLTLVSTVLVTRHLGVEGYGDFTAVIVYVSLFSVLFDWGVATLLVRQLAQQKGGEAELVGKVLTLRLLLAFGVGALAAGLAPIFYAGAEHDRLRLGIAVALPTILFSSVASTFGAVFQAQLKLERAALAEVGSQIVAVGLIAVLVTADRPFEEIVAAVVAGAAVNALLMYLLVRSLVRISPQIDTQAWRRILVQAFPLGASLVLNAIYFRVDAFLLSLMRGPRDVGIYGLAWRFLEVLTVFPYFFVIAVFPLLAASAHAGDLGGLRQLSQRSFDALVVAAIPLTVGIVATAPELVRIVAGEEFEPAVGPLRLVMVGAAIAFVTTLLGYLIVALDRQLQALWLSVVALALNLGLNLLLIPEYGYWAAAAIATATDFTILVGLLWLMHRFAGFTPSLGVTMRAAVGGALLFAAAFALRGNLAAAVLAGATVYAAALYVLRVPQALGLRELLGGMRSRPGS